MKKLPPRTALVCHLHFERGLTPAQIAKRLGIKKIGTVEAHLKCAEEVFAKERKRRKDRRMPRRRS